ncbi:peptidase M50 [Caenimonas sedimenti]|uniref:Peptidase M50 n=1 Tax=Caenimonas sedimenti TaxID=2596921 RepID=A0A562ZPW6_9BURK|nr:site-2 protease family protein [Caenimonas sedimenti]TWO70632.1 peptidase M50 [Caenimonas sedimenti]
MDAPLVSASWHRVASLRPSLAPGLRIVRQEVRNQIWHLLLEPASGQQMRLNPAAYDLVGRFDGRATTGELWDEVLRLRRDEAPTQDETLALLAQLFRAGMVQFDAAPHLAMLFARRAETRQPRQRGFVNPMMLRMQLGDPSRWLQRLTPLAHALFSPLGALAWLALVLVALLGAATEWHALGADTARLLASPSAYVLALLCYPLVKSLHELGHGLAVRRFGGEVREVGVALMFLTPALYVDAGAANAFASPRQRALVSAAGILVELALAAIAFIVWVAASPGLVRDAALAVALIGSVSTLFFNGNPLLRLDGYFVLCDALQLPNLAARSQAWWARLLRRWVGLSAGPAPMLAAGEAKWLALYAPASALYRISLLCALVFWVGRQAWLLGWMAGSVAAFYVARGAWRWLAAAGPRVQWAGAGTAALALLLLVVVPAPQSVLVRGVVWPPAEAQLRAVSGGFVRAVLRPDGAQAQAGEAVLALDDPALASARERLAAEQTGLRARQYRALLSDPSIALQLQSDIDRNAAELARAEQQLAGLEVRPAVAGRVAWARPTDLPGTYAPRGQLLGYLLAPGPAQVRLALPEEDFSRVRGRVRDVELRIDDDPRTVHSARLAPGVPGATFELPSAALGDRHGGPIAVDPLDTKGLRTLAPVFFLDVTVDALEARRVGTRAWVKLHLPDEPLAVQLARRWSQLFVKHFAPTGQL